MAVDTPDEFMVVDIPGEFMEIDISRQPVDDYILGESMVFVLVLNESKEAELDQYESKARLVNLDQLMVLVKFHIELMVVVIILQGSIVMVICQSEFTGKFVIQGESMVGIVQPGYIAISIQAGCCKYLDIYFPL